MSPMRIKVAVPAPFFHPLDYLPGNTPVTLGCRVVVPLGRRKIVGVVTGLVDQVEDNDGIKCRPIETNLDEDGPSIPAPVLRLCEWAARYYQHPIGEVLAAALPAYLRKIKPPAERATQARASSKTRKALSKVQALNPGQQAALQALETGAGTFSVSLLEGVTGSGKTEVYLARVQQVIDQGLQALVLTPEIGLTPQLLDRFKARFGDAVAVMHSGLGDKARASAWRAAHEGRCRVLIGTRSAVFASMPKLGLIVIDEEHDQSYKQQESFRYSARDVAVVRAQQAKLPLILGSATPSLESLHNAQSGRYLHVHLQERATAQRLPELRLLDVRGMSLDHGLSKPLLDAIERHLQAGGQVLMFVNRRGYAPAVLCHDCGWVAPCPHCDARLTLHRARGKLICHHCGAQARVPLRCEACSGTTLIPVGQGTERVDEALQAHFPRARIERMDSDRARKAGELKRLLKEVRNRDIQILVGTQMLAKGHDFDGLTLVGVVTADQALYSADFRAIERMAQMLTQVSGRAGRGEVAGEVIVQTHEPEHPQLQNWLEQGYAGLAKGLLAERRSARLPPFGHLALLRADALDAQLAHAFLQRVATLITRGPIDVLGPIPAPMERRANRFRAQLLLSCESRARLQNLLSKLVPQIDSIEGARRVRWSVDVDPIDLF
tara:strand:+ start:1234 stop:3228 length:1995 start_codon:yes stop_codon:yes gene_type:complete